MSGAQDAKNFAAMQSLARASGPGEDGLWNLDDIQARQDVDIEVPPGARFSLKDPNELFRRNLFGGASPMPNMGLQEWIGKHGMDLPTYQKQFGSLPLQFNNDGTATYDPAFQRVSFEHVPSSYARNQTIGLSLISMLAGTGFAGLGGAAAEGASAGAAAAGGTGGTIKGGFSSLFNIPSTGSALGDFAVKTGVNTLGSQAVNKIIPGGGTLANFAAGFAGGGGVPAYTDVGSFTGDASQGWDNYASVFGDTPMDFSGFGDWLGGGDVGMGDSFLPDMGASLFDFSGSAGDPWFDTSTLNFDLGNDPSTAGYINSVDAGGMASLAQPGGFQQFLNYLRQNKKMLAGGLDIGKSLYGMLQANRMQKLAQGAAERADPYGPYRAQAAQRLAALQADPSTLVNTPGYEAGLQAVQRGLAGSGYLGSGNEKIALQKYGGDAYNQQIQQLAQLSGAQFAPGAGASISTAGTAAANNLRGNALGNLVRGIYSWGF